MLKNKLIITSLVLGVLCLSIFIFLFRDKKEVLCEDCNVILITMTNLRYDHASFNGYNRKTTPNLDKLAAKSIVFDNAFGHSSWTLPESISLMTGIYPLNHGVMNRYDGSKLQDSTISIVDVLRSNGYKTASFTGLFDHGVDYGLTGRFDTNFGCKRLDPRDGNYELYGRLDCSVKNSISFLEANKNNKFFMHVQGFDAHCPFSQNKKSFFDPDYSGDVDFSNCLWTFENTDPVVVNGENKSLVYSVKTGIDKPIYLDKRDIYHLEAIYDDSILSADKEVGKLIDYLEQNNLIEKTIIVFTSEHGDMFGKNGRFMRGGPIHGTFYDDVIHIPLLVYYPKAIFKKVSSLVQHVDIAPSLLSMLGIGPDQMGDIDGVDFLPTLKGFDIHDYILAGSKYTLLDHTNDYFDHDSLIKVVRSLNWKLIRETNEGEEINELYNIKDDPNETKNLYNDNKDIYKKLLEVID